MKALAHFVGGPMDGWVYTVDQCAESYEVCRPRDLGYVSFALLEAAPVSPAEELGVYARVGDLMLWMGWR